MMLKIAHRGASGYEPENTLLSFRKALDLGVDVIEFDVRVCKTGELVVIHDDKVDRTSNGKGYVSNKTLKELKSLNASKGEKIPTAEEVLDLIDKKVKVNIELKGDNSAKPVFELIEKYVKKKKWSYADFFVSSFKQKLLKEFNKLNPKVKIGILIEKIPRVFAEITGKIKVYSINLSLKFVNKKFVEDAHKRNLKVFVFNVNEFDDIKKMKKLGVDGIFSNYPDRI